MSRSPSMRRVVLPLDRNSNEERLLLPATVLARWFETSIQVVTPDTEAVDRYNRLAAGLGVPVEPVVVLDADSFAADLASHLELDPPALCVVKADHAGIDLARAMSQATFLMAAIDGHRMATGPLVVPTTGTNSDIDALALAAIWAASLDLQVRLIVDTDDPDPDSRMEEARAARQRLAEMGIEAAIDRIRSRGLDPAVALARSRSATAMVVAVDHEDLDDLVTAARDRGVSVLLAPAGHDRQQLDSTSSTEGTGPTPVEIDGAKTMSEQECADLLAKRRVGRLGYVDDGWPVIVPVNITMSDGDLFIRSLPGTKVSAAHRNEIVCLQVDRIDEDSMQGWSVLAHGPMEEIHDPQVLRIAWENDPGPWVGSDRWHWLRIRPLSLTGRSVAAAPSA